MHMMMAPITLRIQILGLREHIHLIRKLKSFMISSQKTNTLQDEKQTKSYTTNIAGVSSLLHRVRQHGQREGDAGSGELCVD